MADQETNTWAVDATIPNLIDLEYDDPEPELNDKLPLDEFEYTNVDVKIAEGDVHILLTANEADDIVVPSSILRESRYFTQAFSGNWKADVKKIKSKGSEKVVEIRRWTLKSVLEDEGGPEEGDDSKIKDTRIYLLEGGANRPAEDEDESNMRTIWKSEFATGDIPDRHEEFDSDWSWKNSFTKRQHAATAHKVLFGFLVHKPIQLPTNVSRSMTIMADVLMYAELYGLMERIVHQARDAIQWAGLWDDIAKHPEFYLGLSQVLRAEDVFLEAFKHIVAVRCLHMRGRRDHCVSQNLFVDLGDLKEMTYDELRFSVLEHRVELTRVAGKLLEDLQKQLRFKVPLYQKRGKGEGDKVVFTYEHKFLDPKQFDRYGELLEGHEKWRVYGRNQNERMGLITRGFFAEWLSYELTEQVMSGCDRTKDIQMFGIYKRILEAQETHDLAIFGDKAAQRLADVFSNPETTPWNGKEESSTKDNAIQMIESHLHWLLRDASRAINQTLKRNNAQQDCEGYGGRNTGTMRPVYEFVHAPAKADVNYLAHIDLRYVKIPWIEKGDFPKHEDPRLNMDVDAADEWMALVYGPEYQDEAEDKETTSMEAVPDGAEKQLPSIFG